MQPRWFCFWALLIVLAAFGCEPTSAPGPVSTEAPLRVNDVLARQQFNLSAWPGQPVTLRAFIGGTSIENPEGADYFMVTMTAPRADLSKLPPRHWVIALDVSSSMQGRGWHLASLGAQRLLERLRPVDRVALVTVGKTAVIHVAFEAPAKALAALAALKPDFAPAPEVHSRALHHLAQGLLLMAEDAGVPTAGFFFSDLAGAPATLPQDLERLTRAGAMIHLLCVPGGEDHLLPRLQSATPGHVLFLAHERDIRWHLNERLSEHFDTRARDVRVSVWFDEDVRFSHVMTTVPLVLGADSPSHSLGGKGHVEALPAIANLGAGESRVWVFRMLRWERVILPAIEVRACGFGPAGSPFVLRAKPEREYVRLKGRRSSGGSFHALNKAVFLTEQVEMLREATASGLVYGRVSWDRVHGRLLRHAKRFEQMNLTVSDADIIRAARCLKAMGKLSQTDIDCLRQQRHGALNASSLPPTMQSRGFPLRVLETLFF